MDRLTKNIQVKKEILLHLDNQVCYISTKQLNSAISQFNLSLSTIYKLCNELKQEISAVYPKHEMELIIDSRDGLLLNRNNVNFQKIFSHLFTSDSFYRIIVEVFENRQLRTINFCINHHISESQLRRKIKRLNIDYLNYYQLHISVSKNITLKGTESQIRYFYFQFLLAVHQQFSLIPWIKKPFYYLKQTKQIEKHLNLSLSDNHFEILAIWFYVNDYSGTYINFSEMNKEMIPVRYASLTQPVKFWNIDTYVFFIFFLYCSNLFDFKLQFEEGATDYQSVLADGIDWTNIFIENFHSTVCCSREEIEKQIIKMIFQQRFFQSDFGFTRDPDERFLLEKKQQSPRYFKTFENFYTLYQSSEIAKNLKLSKVDCYFLCVSFIDLKYYIPQINLFLHTYLDTNRHLALEKNLQHFFSNRTNLFFSSNLEEADLLITTFGDEKEETCFGLDRVVICPEPTSKDYLQIEQKINQFIYNQYQ